jgi:SOS-response transcriptional repressor LexA
MSAIHMTEISATSIRNFRQLENLHSALTHCETDAMDGIAERIDLRLADLGMSKAEAERRSKNYRGMIQQIGAGKARMPSGDRLNRLARTLECDVEYLLGEQPMPKRQRSGAMEIRVSSGICIVGKVEAGRFMLIDDEYGRAEGALIEAPRHHLFPGARHGAWIVEGDSMNEAGFQPGDHAIGVFWDEIGFAPMNGMIVVAERIRDNGMMHELTLKEVEVTPEGYNLIPRSSNKSHRTIALPKNFEDDTTTVRVVALIYQVVKKVGPI